MTIPDNEVLAVRSLCDALRRDADAEPESPQGRRVAHILCSIAPDYDRLLELMSTPTLYLSNDERLVVRLARTLCEELAWLREFQPTDDANVGPRR